MANFTDKNSDTAELQLLLLMPSEVVNISTERLSLVPIRSEHADAMFEVLSDASLYDFTGDEPPESLAKLRERYKFLESRVSPGEDELWLNWVISENATDTLIGYVQATVNHRTADLAWVTGTPWQGKGFASEAAHEVLSWLGGHGVTVFRANINPRNHASQGVATNTGLVQTSEIVDGENVWVRSLAQTP